MKIFVEFSVATKLNQGTYITKQCHKLFKLEMMNTIISGAIYELWSQKKRPEFYDIY